MKDRQIFDRDRVLKPHLENTSLLSIQNAIPYLYGKSEII
jgi:hypothetical protein